MTRFAIIAAAPVLALAAMPSAAQDHSGHAGHTMPAPPPAPAQETAEMDHCAMGHLPPEQCPPKERAASADEPDHSAMDHSKMDQTEGDHAAMGHTMPAPVSSAPPPPAAFEGPQHAADLIFGAEAMAPARAANHAMHGNMKFGVFLAERLEARFSDGEEAFLWDVQGWYGGDIDKFVLKSEGEGELGGAVEDAEIQALWGHAIGPFFDLQAGARLDIEPETRSHLVLGVQGLAPYMWHVDAAAFLSDRGDLTARIEGEYDQKLTQRLILQPRVELELSAQDIPERETASGLVKIETGVRLRYEIAREFAPYIGVEYEAKLGDTADLARAAGEDPDGVALVIGLRAWF